MLIDTCAIAQRAPDRAQFEQMTAEWVAAGNKIETVENRPSNPILPFQISERSAARTQTKRSPRKPRSKRKQPDSDLAAFARHMLERGI